MSRRAVLKVRTSIQHYGVRRRPDIPHVGQFQTKKDFSRLTDRGDSNNAQLWLPRFTWFTFRALASLRSSFSFFFN